MRYTVSAPASLHAAIQLPASKSISNRALILHSLAHGNILPRNLSDCDDTIVMTRALDGNPGHIDILAAGTAMRFLTAYLSVTPGTRIITGTQRMQQRPIRILVDALRELGARIEYVGNEGFPPLRITGTELTGSEISLAGNVSSQYISALLMIAPYMQNGLELTLTGKIVSTPYIEMTLEMMSYFDIEAHRSNNTIRIPAGRYCPKQFRIEPDWSAASYWYEIAALTPEADIFLPNLSNKSLQGDARIAALFEPLGVSSLFSQEGTKLRKSDRSISLYEQDLSEQPDLAQTLVVTCCLIGLPFKFTGLQTLKIKETDRISALQNELIKLGYKLISSDRSLEWNGESIAPKVAPVIETYDDHRMAMAFAPASFLFPGIKIKDISVVDKSYPNYWKDLCKAGFSLEKDEKEGTRL